MTATESPLAPKLPIPVFRTSEQVERYMLYDINVITWLRKAHNILGVLIGTLPQIPQQNVFLGLPLELQPEEARLLVEKGIAFIIVDLDWHRKGLRSKTPAQIEAIRADLHNDGIEIARDVERGKQSRTKNALNKFSNRDEATGVQNSNPSPTPETEDYASEDTLFGESLTQENTLTPTAPPSQSANSNISPWTTTTTSSYRPLGLPPISTSTELPKVNASSYALFAHLHRLGYFITPGIRFGCQFSVYPGDPLRFHSHFLSMSYDWDEEIDLLDLVGGGRLGTGVKKGWLIGGIKGKDCDGQVKSPDVGATIDDEGQGAVRTFCVEWGGM